jgi:high-affinity K+ transport system ATPase subunit B
MFVVKEALTTAQIGRADGRCPPHSSEPSAWLWFTVLFAILAEAGGGRQAQAEARARRCDTPATRGPAQNRCGAAATQVVSSIR